VVAVIAFPEGVAARVPIARRRRPADVPAGAVADRVVTA